jgi:L,D-peptidoglycan transpeptidase YkuD (ErfK/YbiS/YcfS/YnhG family)
MKRLKVPLTIMVLLLSATARAEIPGQSLQAIVVKTTDWTAVPARILLYERQGPAEKWEKVGGTIQAVVGKKGMGWGKGIFSPADATGNTFRKEGDKRAPAGIFTIGSTFGITPTTYAKKTLNLKMPYIHITDTVQCIGDSVSEYYNMIVDTQSVTRDWIDESANEMMFLDAVRDEGAYRWGFFIDHNSDKNPLPAMKRDRVSGSCIFMHIWKNSETGTSGCTATDEENLVKIIKWLDYKKNPVFIQLPDFEYDRLKGRWQLP